MIPPPPRFTLFPYTTLFRSLLDVRGRRSHHRLARVEPVKAGGKGRARRGARVLQRIAVALAYPRLERVAVLVGRLDVPGFPVLEVRFAEVDRLRTLE